MEKLSFYTNTHLLLIFFLCKNIFFVLLVIIVFSKYQVLVIAIIDFQSLKDITGRHVWSHLSVDVSRLTQNVDLKDVNVMMILLSRTELVVSMGVLIKSLNMSDTVYITPKT